jgi:hypothetical protein
MSCEWPIRCIERKRLGLRGLVMLKIERIADELGTRIRMSGQLRGDQLEQVIAEVQCGGAIALDLEEVDLVDVEAVRFLNTCEAQQIGVWHCSPYIKEWMLRERTGKK